MVGADFHTHPKLAPIQGQLVHLKLIGKLGVPQASESICFLYSTGMPVMGDDGSTKGNRLGESNLGSCASSSVAILLVSSVMDGIASYPPAAYRHGVQSPQRDWFPASGHIQKEFKLAAGQLHAHQDRLVIQVKASQTYNVISGVSSSFFM